MRVVASVAARTREDILPVYSGHATCTLQLGSVQAGVIAVGKGRPVHHPEESDVDSKVYQQLEAVVLKPRFREVLPTSQTLWLRAGDIRHCVMSLLPRSTVLPESSIGSPHLDRRRCTARCFLHAETGVRPKASKENLKPS